MCLNRALLLPGIKCYLLIKMSPCRRICRKRVFCPLPCQWSGMAVSYPREIFDHPAGASSVGSAACERQRDSDTAVAAEWNQWWMTCQNGPRCLHRRLYWQAQLSHLTFSISRANHRSCWPQMWHMNIAPVIAHLSTSHSQRAAFTQLRCWMKLVVKDKGKRSISHFVPLCRFNMATFTLHAQGPNCDPSFCLQVTHIWFFLSVNKTNTIFFISDLDLHMWSYIWIISDLWLCDRCQSGQIELFCFF